VSGKTCETVHDDDARDAEVAGLFPHELGANADAVSGMDDDEDEVGHAEGVDGLADEV
jgi:hypothetical protein